VHVVEHTNPSAPVAETQTLELQSRSVEQLAPSGESAPDSVPPASSFSDAPFESGLPESVGAAPVSGGGAASEGFTVQAGAGYPPLSIACFAVLRMRLCHG
jgi:hypothetical protein